MKRLNDKAQGLKELSAAEGLITGGGIPWSSLGKGSFISWLGGQVIDHWSEIKDGFKAGFRSDI